MPTQPTTNNLEGWEEKFDKEFWQLYTGYPVGTFGERIKQFISSLRKHDKLELIKMFPKEGDDNYDLAPTDRQIGYDIALGIIKEYYEK